MYTLNKHPKRDNIMDAYLWHCELGHINKNRMNRLTQEGIIEVNDCESLPTCKSYLLEKMTKSSFTEKDGQARDVLGLILTDVCEPMNTSARGRYHILLC